MSDAGQTQPRGWMPEGLATDLVTPRVLTCSGVKMRWHITSLPQIWPRARNRGSCGTPIDGLKSPNARLPFTQPQHRYAAQHSHPGRRHHECRPNERSDFSSVEKQYLSNSAEG